mgnify:CR=1 FL=1
MTIAKLKNAKVAPQKMRLVADQIRGKPVEEAINLLNFSNKKAAGLLKKILESAVANAAPGPGGNSIAWAGGGGDWGRSCKRS